MEGYKMGEYTEGFVPFADLSKEEMQQARKDFIEGKPTGDRGVVVRLPSIVHAAAEEQGIGISRSVLDGLVVQEATHTVNFAKGKDRVPYSRPRS